MECVPQLSPPLNSLPILLSLALSCTKLYLSMRAPPRHLAAVIAPGDIAACALNMPDLRRSFPLSKCAACSGIVHWCLLQLLVGYDADILPTRSLLLAASSKSGSICFVLLSLLAGPLLPLPFEVPLEWAIPFCAELDPACPDTYRWNLTGKLSLMPLLLPFLEAPLPTLPLPGLPLPDGASLAARDL